MNKNNIYSKAVPTSASNSLIGISGVANVDKLTLTETEIYANEVLDFFSKHTNYKHGANNPYLNWLSNISSLKTEEVIDWMNWWFPISRRQPQLLYSIAAAYPDHDDRKRIFKNVMEEDGMVREFDNTHYDLLEMLINKLGGTLSPYSESVEMIEELHHGMKCMTPAEASGYVMGIEYPALDISNYFQRLIVLTGREELITEDVYIAIHIKVEPWHILWSYNSAIKYMNMGKKEHKEVIDSFKKVMKLWERFWPKAFEKLNYPYA